MADEALACFQSLIHSVPEWIAELEKIVECANARQKLLLLENQSWEKSEWAKIHRKKESKSSSLQSRPRNEESRYSSATKLEMLRPALPHVADSDTLRLAQRERKTNSACSGHESGRQKYRSRSLIVIYYDGEVQRGFEKLVRAVGAARNSIRKGKMGAKVEALTRSGSSSSENNSSGDDSPFSHKHHTLRPLRSNRGTLACDARVQVFDRVDGRLEKGQALCERAAHQVLRDGDCFAEVKNVREYFHEALSFAAEELPSLKRRAERSALRRERSEERRRVVATSEKVVKLENMDISPFALHAMPPGQISMEADTLEADDDNDEDDFSEYDLNSFQMGKLQLRRGPPINSLRAFA